VNEKIERERERERERRVVQEGWATLHQATWPPREKKKKKKVYVLGNYVRAS
jgi:hypothetical protein